MLATNITVIEGAAGAGNLDHFLSAGNGTITVADDPGDTAATLSAGALLGVGAHTDISIAADNSITFNDVGTLALQTAMGASDTFTTTSGPISLSNLANTVTTVGGAMIFSAGTDLAVANLNTNGGDVSLTAGTSGTGDLTAQGILTSGSGNITLSATDGTLTQTGAASGQAINATANGDVTVDSLRGTSVALTSLTGSVTSSGASPIQGSAEVTLSAATGINVFTLTPSIRATNSTSGNVIITQLPPPNQDLTVVGSGVVNQATGGIISLTNSAGNLSVAGSTVATNNGTIFLAGTGLDLAAGTVNSGTAATELHNSLAGLAFDIGHKVAGKIGLTQSDLDAITASVLRIGTNSAGSINVSAAIHGDASWNSTLALIANGPITEAAAGSLTLANLRISAVGPASLLSVNNVQDLAGDVGGSANSFGFNNGTNTLTIPNAGVDGVLGLASNNGNIDLIADNILVRQAVMPGTGTAILEPFTQTLNITLGTASVPGSTFGITNGGLGWITSGVTQVGTAVDTGTITITGAINRTPTSTAPSRSQTLDLVTGNTTASAVTQTATLSVANLAVQSAGAVTLTNASNDVDSLAAAVTGAANNFEFTDSVGFTVSTVAGVAGISTATGTTETVVLTAGGSVSQDGGANIASQNLLLLGTGGYSLTATGNDVTTLAANVTNSVSYTDANDLTIGAVVDPATVTTTMGVTSNGGDINITASANTSGTTLTVSNAIDTTSDANITLNADQMALLAAVNAHAGIVTLAPTTSGRAVDLGTNSDTTHLGLLQPELDNVTAGVLRIGDLSTSGSITVTSAITDATTGWSTLSLLTEVGAGISQNSGDTLTVTNLNAGGNTGVTLNEDNVVSTLAGATESGSFSFVDSTNLTVDNVDSGLGGGFGSGIITEGQPVSLTVNVLNDSLTVNQTIDTTHEFSTPVPGGADITLTADNMALNNNSPSSTIDAGTGGILTLTPFMPSNTIAVGGPDAAGQLGIDDNDLTNITAKAVRIGSSAQTGAVTVDGTINTHPGYNTLDLIAPGSGGAVTQTTGSIDVANLALQADAGIGSAGAIQVVGPISVAFQNVTSNNVQMTSTGAVTVNAVDGVSASANNAVGGTLTLTASSPMTFSVNTTSSGTITATTTETVNEGTLPPPDDDITVNSGVTVESSGGDVDFTSGDSIVTQSGSTLKSDTGAVSLTAGMGDNDNDASTSISGLVTASTQPTVTGGSSLVVDYTAGASLPQGLQFNAAVAGATLTTSDAGGTTPHIYDITDTSISRDGAASITYNTTNTDVSGVTVTGSDSSGSTGDTFNITPSTTVIFTVHGGLPTPPARPGDELNLSSYTHATLSATFSAATGFSGDWTFNDGSMPVNFDGIETLGGTTDVAITKTDNSSTPGSAAPGASLTYTIVVSNLGSSDATGATVADTFPSGFTGASFTATETGGANGFTASGSGPISDTVNLPAGSTITYVVTGTISSSATGTLSNTATVTPPADVIEANTANDTATDTLTLTPQVNLTIGKSDNKGGDSTTSTTGSVMAGTAMTYTIVVSNAGPSDVTGAKIADTFPVGFTGATYTATATGTATGFTASGSGNVNDTVNLPSGSSITYVVAGTVASSAAGTLSNTANVTVPAGVTNTGSSSATDTDTVTAQANLSVSKSDNKGGDSATSSTGSVVAGTAMTYTVVVSNTGPSDVTGAKIADTFPVGFTGATYTATATGTATGFTASGSGNINDTVNLPAGSSITYVVAGTVASSATGTLSNTANVTVPAGVTNTGGASATDTDTVTAQANLSVSKSDNKGGNSTTSSTGSVVAGTSMTYTIVVSNTGPSDVTGAKIADNFPAGFTGATYTTTATGAATGFTASGSGNINDTVDLPTGSSITYVVAGTVASSATGTLSNTANVTVPAGVTNTGSSNATDTDTVTAQANLSVSKSDNKGGNSTTSSTGSVVAGTSMTYTIVVSNSGPSDVTGAKIADDFPVGFTGATYTATATGAATGFTASGSGNINDTVDLPTGSSITYVVAGTVASSATGTLSNTANVTVPAGVTNTGSSSATDKDTVTATADVTVSKSDNKGGNSTTGMNGSVALGSTLTYTVVVSNTGPSDVSGANIADALPSDFAGITFTASATGGATGFSASGSGNINDTVNLPAGSSITYVITGTVSATPFSLKLSNTAIASVPAGVTNTGNTSASVTDTITVAAGLGYLAGTPGDSTVQTFVHNLYRELLGREPDAAGDSFWATQLQQNNTAAGRQAVVAGFMNSQEYKEHYITTLYEAFLGRTPDASGLQFWTAKMGDPGAADGHNGSADEKFILAAILGSDEFYTHAGGTNQSFAQALYLDLLGRSGEPAGITAWTDLAKAQPQNRDGVVRLFLSTPEAEHKLLDSFYPGQGGTASHPLPAPGTGVAVGSYDLAVLTGDGWENLYLGGAFDSAPEGNDAFFTDLGNGGSWDDVQFELLTTDQFYNNPNRPVTS